jgi:transcriptional regulator with GAF, ATPase, and Fis domain
MNPRLIAISGPQKGLELPFTEKKMTVGRAADNDVVLDDELASKHHFAYWLNGGRPYIKDLDTRNGTFIDGEACLEKFLKEWNRIKCGSTIFLFAIQDEVPKKLLIVIEGEIERNRDLETLRADYSSRGDLAAYYRGAIKSTLQMTACLSAISDPPELMAKLLDLMFDIFPARRGAILINGNRVSPDPDDFALQVYRERDSDSDARFPVSRTILEEVYKARVALMPKSAIPPVLCAPLLADNVIKGVLYLEAANSGKKFEPEDLNFIEGPASLVVAGLRESRQVVSTRRERDVLKAERNTDYLLVGESSAMQSVLDLIEVAAQSDNPVLITGETGTGKELIARMIHANSSRAGKAFVAVNCAAVPETVFESTFFGHVKGAFTGATEAGEGKFKLADGATLLLDEVGEIPLGMQPKLLRALQEGEIQPVGGKQAAKVDVRIIASTNVDLAQAIQKGTFRSDLFYRLNTMTIAVPPLRERCEDIPLLVRHFLDTYGASRGVLEIAPEALKVLMSYDWPGNVRELQGIITAAVEFARHANTTEISPKHLPAGLAEPKRAAAGAIQGNAPKKARTVAVELMRAEAVKVFEQTRNGPEAARRMGISEGYLYRLLREAKSKER